MRRKNWTSLQVPARLGRCDVEECKLGPLNTNAVGDTRSTLGTDPWREEFGRVPKLEARDRDSGVVSADVELLLLLKNDVMYFWKATRGFCRMP